MEIQKRKQEEKYRHEFKYIITAFQETMLKERIPKVMKADAHTGDTGKYTIRSLYFDDYYNSCYYDNENGNDPREKFRIRIYNASSRSIKLELKRKEAGKTLKKSCKITQEQCERMMRGDRVLWEEDMHPLLKKFYLQQEIRRLKPVIIVEYDRMPFVCQDGNVRVTLDLDIRSSAKAEDFLKDTLSAKPLMPVGKQILEVKYDEFLPDAIYKTIQMKKLQQTAFSKYYLCRKYTQVLGGN